jgi:hypothetical protein
VSSLHVFLFKDVIFDRPFHVWVPHTKQIYEIIKIFIVLFVMVKRSQILHQGLQRLVVLAIASNLFTQTLDSFAQQFFLLREHLLFEISD